MKLLTVIILGLLFSINADAKAKAPRGKTLKIIRVAAKRFGVDVNDLLRIAFTESSFRPNISRINVNKKGKNIIGFSIDYGMFQINSIHWSTTCQEFDVFTLEGNASCAAKLLSHIREFENKDKNWKGRYHSKTPSRKRAYALKLASVELH